MCIAYTVLQANTVYVKLYTLNYKSSHHFYTTVSIFLCIEFLVFIAVSFSQNNVNKIIELEILQKSNVCAEKEIHATI